MVDTSELKSGTCPGCGSTEVYSNSNLPSRGERNSISVSGMRRLYMFVIICTKCGLFYEYIPQNELDDEKAIEKIKETWLKIN